jgi:hypothetical protein
MIKMNPMAIPIANNARKEFAIIIVKFKLKARIIILVNKFYLKISGNGYMHASLWKTEIAYV